jgi:hypothetical protein
MNMNGVLIVGVIAIIGVTTIILWIRVNERKINVSVQNNILYVGRNRLPISDITRIDIAPLYDVAPADDLWIFEGSSENKISFFNRDPGASSALPLLEGTLNGLNLEKALSKARDESIFEEPVNVWMVK